jgi:hypothetical protein
MKHFIQPDKTRINVNEFKIDRFINVFNSLIKAHSNTSYSKNTGLSNIPELTEEEFKLVKECAEKDGFILTAHEDNYNTITYTITLMP